MKNKEEYKYANFKDDVLSLKKAMHSLDKTRKGSMASDETKQAIRDLIEVANGMLSGIETGSCNTKFKAYIAIYEYIKLNEKKSCKRVLGELIMLYRYVLDADVISKMLEYLEYQCYICKSDVSFINMNNEKVKYMHYKVDEDRGDEFYREFSLGERNE